MLAQVTLTITPEAARLTLVKGDKCLEDERWKFDRKIGSTEATEAAKAIFDDAYDALNWMVHGDE